MPRVVHRRHSHTVLIPSASRQPVVLPEHIQAQRALVRDFLKTRVGQSWKQVHAEIKALPEKDRSVLLNMIATRTLLIDGAPHYYPGRSRRRADLRSIDPRTFFHGYYVCPEAGALKFMRYLGAHSS